MHERAVHRRRHPLRPRDAPAHPFLDRVQAGIAASARLLVAARPIRRGEVLTPDAMTAKRPADGLSPMQQWRLIGTAAQRDYAPDDALEAHDGDGQGTA